MDITASYLAYSLAYHHWATLELIAFCETQSSEVLARDGAGLYGDIPATFGHLASAELGFYAALLGRVPDGASFEPPATLAAAAGLVRVLGEAWQAFAADPLPAGHELHGPRGTVLAATVLAQVLNHGSEHRQQVATILGAAGIEPPVVHPWAFEGARQAGR